MSVVTWTGEVSIRKHEDSLWKIVVASTQIFVQSQSAGLLLEIFL